MAHLCVAEDASAEAPPRGPRKRRTEVAMVLCTSWKKMMIHFAAVGMITGRRSADRTGTGRRSSLPAVRNSPPENDIAPNETMQHAKCSLRLLVVFINTPNSQR